MARATHSDTLKQHSLYPPGNNTRCILPETTLNVSSRKEKYPNTQISGKSLKEVDIPGMGSSRSRSLVETGALWGWAAWDGRTLGERARACVSHVSAGAQRAVCSSGWGKSKRGEREREIARRKVETPHRWLADICIVFENVYRETWENPFEGFCKTV